MIALLKGELVERQPSRVVLDVNGVGYELFVPISTYSGLPASGRVSLLVYTHVREDAIHLYGFATAREKHLFERLIAVSGIGPKLALSILSGIAVEDLASAIRSSDVARLTGIPGVGKKTAERLVVELRDKMTAGPEPATAAASSPSDDVISALLNLGYQRPLAEQTVARAVAGGKFNGFDDLFKESMRRIREK